MKYTKITLAAIIIVLSSQTSFFSGLFEASASEKPVKQEYKFPPLQIEQAFLEILDFAPNQKALKWHKRPIVAYASIGGNVSNIRRVIAEKRVSKLFEELSFLHNNRDDVARLLTNQDIIDDQGLGKKVNFIFGFFDSDSVFESFVDRKTKAACDSSKDNTVKAICFSERDHFMVVWHKDGEIFSFFSAINLTKREYINEWMIVKSALYGLGLTGKQTASIHSNLSDHSYSYLTEFDQDILTFLYCDELLPGMSKKEIENQVSRNEQEFCR